VDSHCSHAGLFKNVRRPNEQDIARGGTSIHAYARTCRDASGKIERKMKYRSCLRSSADSEVAAHRQFTRTAQIVGITCQGPEENLLAIPAVEFNA
jgi:hypothetical protein